MTAKERSAIETVIRDYLEGMIYGELDKLRRAMHAQCIVAGHYLGNYDFMPREAFIDQLKGEPPEKPGTPIVFSIQSVDITGDTAIAKVRDDCLGSSFTDYLTLIKHEGQWQIVAKTFFDHGAKD